MAGAGAPGIPRGAGRAELARWSVFAALLAAAGLPVYIHAPAAWAAAPGVGLGALGAVLAGLRLVDLVQDPALGWLAERGRAHRAAMAAAAAGAMALGMLGVFAPPAALAGSLAGFAVAMLLLFSGWSFLTIVFYAEGVEAGARLGAGGHLRLAGWREGGALAGVALAAVAPLVLGLAGFALAFVLLVPAALWAMRGRWAGAAAPQLRWGLLLGDRGLRRLLWLALANGMPVAVTSTLFLFFVEARLAAPAAAGPLLLLFFVAAGLAAPVWAMAARRHGAARVLAAAMGLAVLAFAGTLWLGAGDVAAFALVVVLTGAATGADLVILPALFAARLARLGGAEAAGFALWSFVSKAGLAGAALLLLPALETAGFRPALGAANPAPALQLLGWLYAGLPCALKLAALALLWGINRDDG